MSFKRLSLIFCRLKMNKLIETFLFIHFVILLFVQQKSFEHRLGFATPILNSLKIVQTILRQRNMQ